MIYYKLVKVIINILRLAKVIINKIIWHDNLFDFIINDYRAILISKFWSSLYYFFVNKKQLFTTFYL